jgi:hypothetical protein
MVISTELLRSFLVAEIAIFGLLALATLTSTALGTRRVRQLSIARQAWLAGLAPLVDGAGAVDRRGGEEALVDAAVLDAPNRAERIMEVSRLASQLSGGSARAVVLASGEEEMTASAAAWCRSRRWWRRLRGVRTLTLLRADEPDLTPMLADRVPDVRAEVATWVAANPTDERVVALIAMLDDPESRCRWAAQDALLRIGRPATPALAAHLAAGPRRPVEALRVAAGLATPELLASSLAYCADRRAEVRVAAAESVTAIGGVRTTEVLRSLLVDDDPRVRTAAATGLGELEHWPAQAELAQALQDPVWEVRRAAAAALQRFGPVGRIQLRRAAASPDPQVAEIASHVLDLSDLALVVTP